MLAPSQEENTDSKETPFVSHYDVSPAYTLTVIGWLSFPQCGDSVRFALTGVGRKWNARFGACNGYRQTETPTIDVCLRRHHDTIADSFAESFHSR
jgi:hypothetical protein